MSFPENKKAKTNHEIIPELVGRWSPRAFSDVSVESEKILQILEAARWSASSYNEQPWRYVVGVKGDGGSYDKIFSCLNEFNQLWAGGASVLMLSFAKNHFGDDQNKINRHHWHDTGAASAQLSVQAAALGLYVHQMAGLDYEKIKEIYDLPEDIEPVAALAIGYIGDPSDLPENLQEGEKADRERKPLADFVFGEDFGETNEMVK
jgi:nitroreductase